jgi:Baseplate J-like protein
MAEARALINVATRASLPQEILLNISGPNLLSRMLANPLLDGWAVDERSQVYQAIAPPAFEIAEGYLQLARVIWLRSLVGPDGFIAYGPYLDELGDQEMGVLRRSAQPARIAVEFRGTSAATIPAGTLLATFTAPPVQFRTVTATQLGVDPSTPGGFSGGALADCLELGIVGNVPAGAVTRFPSGAPPNVATVTNPSGVPLIAGSAVEADDDYRTRLLRYRRDPPNGANAAQFRSWAEQVPGVGRAECVRPLEPIGPQDQVPPPPGTVWIFVTGTDLIIPYPGTGLLAAPAVVDAVQQHIAPRRPAVNIEPGDVPTVDLPDNGESTTAAVPLPTDPMEIAGIWSLRVALSLSNPPADLSTPVATLTVFNVTDGLILDGRPNGNAPQAATHTFTAGELTATPPTDPNAAPVLEFFWDGAQVPLQKTIEVRLERTAEQAAPGSGTVTFHGGWIVSVFSDPTHEGLAPVSVRVETFAARPRPVDVEVAIQAKPGWTLGAVQTWVEDALRDYLRSIVFAGAAAPVGGLPDRRANDVLFGMIGAVLYGGCVQGDTPLQFYDPSTLRLNGGTTDVEVWTGDVAILGTVDLRAYAPLVESLEPPP